MKFKDLIDLSFELDKADASETGREVWVTKAQADEIISSAPDIHIGHGITELCGFRFHIDEAPPEQTGNFRGIRFRSLLLYIGLK